MSNGFLGVLQIRVDPVPEGRLVMVIAGVALLAVGISAAAVICKLVLGIGILMEGCRYRRCHLGTAGPARVAAFELGSNGEWRLHLASGVSCPATLERCWGASVGPLIALAWRCDDGRPCHVFLPAMHPDPRLRRLRVRLRLT